jgi:hypothetical protein
MVNGRSLEYRGGPGVFSRPMQIDTVRYVLRPQAILLVCFFAIILTSTATVHAQQRPLLTEDPRLPPSGSLDVEMGFGYEKRAVYTLSNLEGDHVALLPLGLHFGLGDRAEFQMTGTLHDYLHTADGVWYNDFGDISLSTKMKIAGESHKMPAISFRPTVTLPNANQASGLGLNTTRFFASVLAGKTIGKVFLFGNIGFGIMDNPVIAGAQDDPLTYGLAAIIPVASEVGWVAEINGMLNPRTTPAFGSETRRQLRSGFQFKAAGIRWDVGVLAGLTHLDPRYGITFGITKRFGKHQGI